MDRETMFYLFFLISLIAYPCIKYKYYEWQAKQFEKWYQSHVMMEEWKDV